MPPPKPTHRHRLATLPFFTGLATDISMYVKKKKNEKKGKKVNKKEKEKEKKEEPRRPESLLE